MNEPSSLGEDVMGSSAHVVEEEDNSGGVQASIKG